jgi:hypothetical protein
MKVAGCEVWRVVETEIISFARAEHHLTPSQLEANRRYVAMVQQVQTQCRQCYNVSCNVTMFPAML